MLSICTTLKDRWPNFQQMYEGLRSQTDPPPYELVVGDFCSQDIIYEELSRDLLPHWVRIEGDFNRSRGLNRAAMAAHGEILFFLDADMWVPEDFVAQTLATVRRGTCWFPICYSLHEDRPRVVRGDSRKPRLDTNGWWRTTGKGMCGFHRDDFRTLGWDEEIGKTWGWEDVDLYHRATQAGLTIIREKLPGLFHLWHPTKRRLKGRRYRVR